MIVVGKDSEGMEACVGKGWDPKAMAEQIRGVTTLWTHLRGNDGDLRTASTTSLPSLVSTSKKMFPALAFGEDKGYLAALLLG